MTRKLSFLLALVLALGAEICAAAEQADPLLVKTGAGWLRGTLQPGGSHAWLGVPYAAPPVGELRWQPPRPEAAWHDVLSANQANHACPQFVSPLTRQLPNTASSQVVGSEDCLYLNLYAPGGRQRAKPLPVMVWIHGGSNTGGFAGQIDGSMLSQTQDVVVIAINYRLGALGWFRHPAVTHTRSDGSARSGNWATLDLLRALQWVRDNVASFGGDPGNVTVFGQSAGGQSVLALLLSPLSKDLFHRAIVQSGSLYWHSAAEAENFRDDKDPGSQWSGREIVNSILLRDGKATDRAGARQLQQRMSAPQIRELLYAQDAASLLTLYSPQQRHPYWPTTQITDGSVLPTGDLVEAFRAGHFNHMPLILGSTRDEQRIYEWRDPRWSDVLRVAPTDYMQYVGYQNLWLRHQYVDSLARAISAAQPDRVFTYRFDWDELGFLDGVDLRVALGASHSFDVPFVFADWNHSFLPMDAMFPAAGRGARDRLSREMMSYWAQFARRGDPGRGAGAWRPQWLPWDSTAARPKTLLFATKSGGGIRMTTEEVTERSIKQKMLTDRFMDQRLQCEAYAKAFAGKEFLISEYDGLGSEGCTPFAPESLRLN